MFRHLILATAASLAVSAAVAGEVKPLSVDTLPSGVVVEHLVAGQGVLPDVTSRVTVEYVGMLAENGNVFDSSQRHGGPVTFPLNHVIRCWQEGVQRMHVGEQAVLRCPSDTAYGRGGAGYSIPPNADLAFGIHLVAVTQ
ncbi:FKBP-type peptidyl-prolyl cis-trans isomerase [Burkholderia ambifaria]|uniref:FKBP-type peptidyl-prolyl cis-trans isomerase n=1 Tax=Burkholderia ambifaria TaxID=152480 RepID=UPI000F8035D1|nr:FKBP-type peptidyl-prolyl cis-trans isomerase [Burkholderia ambifaria]